MSYIKIHNLHQNYTLLCPTVDRITNHIANYEKMSIKKILIIVTDDGQLNELKQKFFGEDVLTDTITFNYNEQNEPVEGEIYLSVDRIIENSKKYNNNLEYEFATVLVHSILHLLGYEDDTSDNKKQMFALQNFYMQNQNFKRLIRKRHKK